MGTDDLMQLPAINKNVAYFATIMPGVAVASPNERAQNYTSVNGVRANANAWLADGGYNIDTGGNWNITVAPNMETVAEFRALRGNYSAEFGMGGGSQFNVITKSGTNAYHGSAYFYNQSDKLNARNFFVAKKDFLRYNEWGATFGGPVVLPHLYNGRDKTFFFAFVARRTERTRTNFLAKLPETAYRTGDFSALSTVVKDPVTGLAFQGNIIPASRIDANAKAYTAIYPAINYRDAVNNNFSVRRPSATNRLQQNYRIDHYFSQKHRLFGRIMREDPETTYFEAPGYDFFTRTNKTPANNTVINFYSTFRPTLINEASFTRVHNRLMYFPSEFPRAKYGITIPELYKDTADTYPLDSLNLAKIPDDAPIISITNYQGFSPSRPWSNFQSIFDFKDHLTWVHGKHTFKTGFDFAFEKKFEPTNTDVFGSFSFDGRFTGDGYADFLLGMAASYSEATAVAFNDNRRRVVEMYADDSWKVTRRLTLNLGVRYSRIPPAYEPQDRFRSFLPEAYNVSKAVKVQSNGRILKSDPGDRFNGVINPKGYWDWNPYRFAPRVGFSYDIFGTGRTAIRGGVGQFYSREILGAFILMSSNPPFAIQSQLLNTTLSNPGGGSARDYDLPTAIGSIDIHQLHPYSEQWNLDVQQTLTKGMVVEVGYAGSRSIHFMRSRDINMGPLSAQASAGTISADSLRPYAGLSTISHREQSYAANYHAFQVGLDRRFHSGFGLKSAYTWAHTIDNADFTAGIYGVSPYYPNSQIPNGQRGPASLDIRHRSVTSFIYQIPWLKGRRDALGYIVGGWGLSGIALFQTGQPVQPLSGRDMAGIGYTTQQRPVVSGDPTLSKSTRTELKWFDTSKFSQPAAGTLSPLGRMTLRLPGTNNWDMSMAKTVTVYNESTLDIRLEAQNIFNHTQWYQYNSTLTSSSFGKITSARSPRTLQLSLRLKF